MKQKNIILKKWLYALLFTIVMPVILFVWAYYTEDIVRYPAIHSNIAGLLLSIIGLSLLIWGALSIILYGKGLPMNAFPPEKFVSQGAFRLLKNPIYFGFGMFIVGVSIYTGSASGLWLVSPLVVLAMIALVIGHEQIKLDILFKEKNHKVYFNLPSKTVEKPGLKEKVFAILIALLILIIGNYLLGYLLDKQVFKVTNYIEFANLPGNQLFPFISLLFILCVPLFTKTKKQLREWGDGLVLALFFLFLTSFLFPEVGTGYFNVQLSNTTQNNIGIWLFYSIPIFMILLSAIAYTKSLNKGKWIPWILAVILCIYQLSISRTFTSHLIIGIILFLIGAYNKNIWSFLRAGSELIANSWKEWLIGPVRIINHGFYVGVGGIFAILLAGFLVGKEYIWIILIYIITAIVFSGLWAQIIEGSEKLKRPFGYYGALVGFVFGAILLWLFDYDVWLLVGVAAVVGTWVQAIGRLRCLINGCCHGSITEDKQIGIKYFHFRSRVCGISGLKGELLHPTQLYAIIWLLLVGFILLGLWLNNFPSSFIAGMYLILTGIGRFVEEAYRGEIQTPIIKGLRLYQWTAIISFLLGVIVTMLNIPQNRITPEFGWEIVLASIICGFFMFFVMGVDFPKSNSRFSRLV